MNIFLYFILGADIPVNVQHAQMVASPKKDVLYTFGNDALGALDDRERDVYRFKCDGDIYNCAWKRSSLRLKHGREDAVAFSIPDALADELCNN